MSGGETRVTTTQDNNLDPWSEDQYNTQVDRIRGLLDQPYQAYDGSRPSSEMNAAEQRAYDYALGRNPRGAQVAFEEYKPEDFGSFDPDKYVNPHAEGLVANMTADVEEARDRTNTGIEADAAGNGSFGGSRHGVREALVDEAALDTIGDNSSRIRFDAFNTGVQNWQADQDRGERAHYWNQEQRQRAIDRGDAREDQYINDLLRVGGVQRDIENRAFELDYQFWRDGQADYWQRVGAEQNLMNAIPQIMDVTNTSVSRNKPGAMQYIGTALAVVATIYGGPAAGAAVMGGTMANAGGGAGDGGGFGGGFYGNQSQYGGG